MLRHTLTKTSDSEISQLSGCFLSGGNCPHCLHVVPVGDDPSLDGVLQGQDVSPALGLTSHVAIFLSHSHKHTHLQSHLSLHLFVCQTSVVLKLTFCPCSLGRPTTDGKTARGSSSPEKPALHILEPLSITRTGTSSSMSGKKII